MRFKIEKLDLDQPNSTARFRLTHTSELLDVVFTYSTFRESLESLGFSPHRIGSVLRLLHRLYPYPFREVNISLADSYLDKKLIELLRSCGFVVRKIDFDIDIPSAIKILELKGYVVTGFLPEGLYCSPSCFFSIN